MCWEAKICNRTILKRGCPYDAGHKPIPGKTDLVTLYPKLASEWDYALNCDLLPEQVSAKSARKVWWKCRNCGENWQATISSRATGRGCPYDSGRRPIPGKTDLATVYPELASEWDYERNNTLRPEHFTKCSGRKVWWKCNKGHEWQSTIANRNKGNGCPVCNSERKTSFPEYALVYYLQQYGLEVMHSYRGKGYELDIYIPSLKIAIEYDGYYWHKHRTKKDLEKNYKCKKDGIKLYRIRENLPKLNDSSIDYVVRKYQKDLPKIQSYQSSLRAYPFPRKKQAGK